MKIVVILLCSPLIILAVHAVVSRVLHKSSPQVAAVKSILIGYLPTGLLLWGFVFNNITLGGDIILASVYALVVYTAFAYTYFHFFNMSETARRIRIMYEIYMTGSLPAQRVTALYGTGDMIDRRLKRLVAMKQLKYNDGKYSIDGRILYIAAIMVTMWRRVLGFNDRDIGSEKDKWESDMICIDKENDR